MKFNDEELERFREDFTEEIKFLEKKYAIKITLGKIINDETFFSARITAEHAEEPVKKEPIKDKKEEISNAVKEINTIEKKEPPKASKPIVPHKPEIFNKEAAPKKKVVKKKINIQDVDLDNLSDSDLNNIDLDNLGLDNIVAPKKAEPVKPSKVASEAPKPVKKEAKKLDLDDLDNISDEDLENLDLDDLDFEEERKPVKKEAKKLDLDDLDNISDEDLENLDLDDLDFEEERKPVKKEAKKLDLDDLDNISDEDLENLDLDDLDFEEERKPVKKEAKKLDLDDLDNISDEDLENLDLDDLDFEEERKPVKKISKYDESKAVDIEEADDDEFEEIKFRDEEDDDDDLSEFFDDEEEEPTNIFQEKSSKKAYQKTSFEDIDSLLSGTGRYSYSFEAKLIQGEGLVQDFYTDIKNELLGYKGVSSRMSWDNDTFSYGRDILAKVDIEDDKVLLYLALDCDEYADSRYMFKDASNNSKYTYTPMKLVISKFKDEEAAFDLISEMMESFAIENEGPRYDDYHQDFETKEELIDRGLIKKI